MQPLDILIIEDNESDVELIMHQFAKEKLKIRTRVVDTRDGFISNLDSGLPDLILSDYKLPSFDGMSALKIARERCPDIPFILVSGTIGEEFAIETLKSGVNGSMG